MIVNTFRTVFPHTTVWWTIPGDYRLVGTNQPLVVDHDRLRARYDALPAVQEDFKLLGWQSPLALLTLFVLDEEDTARYARGALENTDDRPLLEFSAPLALYVNTTAENHRVLKAARTQTLPPIGGVAEQPLWTKSNRLQFARAVRVRGDAEAALEQLRAMDLSGPGNEMFLLQRAKLLFALGGIGDAMADLSRLSKMSPGRPLIESYLRVGRLFQSHALGKTPLAYGTTGAESPNPALAHNKLGLYYSSLGIKMREPALFDLAVDAFQAALLLEPRAYGVMSNLATAYLEQGLLAQAEATYHRALRIKPDLAEAHANLGLLYERQGALDLAAREYQTALKLRPDWGHVRLGLHRINAVATPKE
jgi:tetratricopeptide (TPR) repeat protein